MITYKKHLEKLVDCPFCKKIHIEVIYTWKFHDVRVAIAPYKENHYLIIPHKHVTSILEYSKEMLEELCILQQKVTKYLYDIWHQEVVLLLRDWNDNDSVRPMKSTTWKSLNHFHYHVIPDCNMRHEDLTTLSISDNRKVLNEKEMKEIKNNRKKWFKNDYL